MENKTVVQPGSAFRVDLAWRREPWQAGERVDENLPLHLRRHAGVWFNESVVVGAQRAASGQGRIRGSRGLRKVSDQLQQFASQNPDVDVVVEWRIE